MGLPNEILPFFQHGISSHDLPASNLNTGENKTFAPSHNSEPFPFAKQLQWSTLSATAITVVGLGAVGGTFSLAIELLASRYLGTFATRAFSTIGDELGTGIVLSKLGNGDIENNVFQGLTSRALIHGLMMAGMGLMLPMPLQMLLMVGNMTVGSKISEWMSYKMGLTNVNPLEEITGDKFLSDFFGTALVAGIAHLIPVAKLIAMAGAPLAMARRPTKKATEEFNRELIINNLSLQSFSDGHLQEGYSEFITATHLRGVILEDVSLKHPGMVVDHLIGLFQTSGLKYHGDTTPADVLASILTLNPKQYPRVLESMTSLIKSSTPEKQYAALEVFRQIAKRKPELLTMDDLLSIGMASELTEKNRGIFLMQAALPYLARCPHALTASQLDSLVQVGQAHPDYKYFIYALSEKPLPQDVQCKVQTELKRLEAAGAFPMRTSVQEQLGTGEANVLIVNNLGEGIGDTFTRNYFIEGLLVNPKLKITIMTPSPSLWNEQRITVIPIKPRGQTSLEGLANNYDAVFDSGTEYSSVRFRNIFNDSQLWRGNQTMPSSHLSVTGGRFISCYDNEASDTYSVRFGVDQIRIGNTRYETRTLNQKPGDQYSALLRLSAEFGLPLQQTGKALAGINNEANKNSWQKLVDSSPRPILLLNPFGGGVMEKGFYGEKHDFSHENLKEILKEFAQKGYRVIVLPGGVHGGKNDPQAWGTHAIAQSLIAQLPPNIRKHIIAAPDLEDLPHGFINHAVAVANEVVTVEGAIHHTLAWLRRKGYVMLTASINPQNRSGSSIWIPDDSQLRIITRENIRSEIPHV